ncbi:MAG: DUF1844 domain-containing protein [Deltaproteobacteria bacterium]|nr:MAG: DUF1844 domain-containing protein [Deltaproteobacteria bacterium]
MSDGTGDERAKPEADPAKADALPAVDFSTFLVSMSTSALYNLGLVADPSTGKRGEVDLTAARHTIDLLEVLKEKTRGNLEEAETRLLDSLLFELRMRFVEVSKE